MSKTITKTNFEANKTDLIKSAECYSELLRSPVKALFECRPPLFFKNKSKELASMFINEDPSSLSVAEMLQELLSTYQFVNDDEYIETALYYLLEAGPEKQLKDYSGNEELPLWLCFYFISLDTYMELVSKLTNDDQIFDLSDYIEDFLYECGIKSFNAKKITLQDIFFHIHSSISKAYTEELLGTDDEELENIKALRNEGISIFDHLILRPFDTIYGSRGTNLTQFLSCNNSNNN